MIPCRFRAFSFLAVLFPVVVFGQNSWSLLSPDSGLRGTVQLADLAGQAGYPSGARLYYSVSIHGPSFVEVVPPSPLGITREDQGFVEGLTFDSASAVTEIDETYTMVTGKKTEIRHQAHEQSLYFRNASGGRLQLVIRASDDGFAFRYRFPETSETTYTVDGETTGFRVPSGSVGWMMPQQPHGQFAPAYEDVYRQVNAGANSPNADGWTLPALFLTPDSNWVFIGETDVMESYAGTRLQQNAANAVYRIRFPNPNEGNGIGDANPSWTLPWEMPWRFVIAGGNPGVILESTLATDLATPSVIASTDWIRPGRASWSWYSNEGSPRNYAQILPFIDLAQEMGWEYSLVDTEWPLMTGGDWQSIIAYATPRNVGIWLWYNGGGPNNSLSAGFNPRDRLWESGPRFNEFLTIASAGVKGIKVDFFHSDKQNIIQYYHALMRDAATFNLMINFHGNTIQRGWQRTYPNLMTTESVRGAEMYKYDNTYPQQQPARNTMLPFTRNVMGSMDYTPVTFTNYANAHNTSHAHQLALSVVFESGVQHFADRVSGFMQRPDSVLAFLRDVPTVWDDTKYLQGGPGTYLLLARRKGHDWWIGGVNGQNNARPVTQALEFLGEGNYAMLLLDDSTMTTFSQSTPNVTSGDQIQVNMLGRGGFAARLIRLDPPTGLQGRRPAPPATLRNPEWYDLNGRRLHPDAKTGTTGPAPALPRATSPRE